MSEKLERPVSPSILTTKLYILLPHPSLVPCPRLIERLNEGLLAMQTLISALSFFVSHALLLPNAP